MTRPATIFVLLLFGTMLTAQTPSPTPAKRLEERKEKAEKMSPQDRALIYSEIVRDLAEIVNEDYNTGAPEKAEGTLKELVDYAEKCVAAAQDKHKKIKEAEINLRRASRRLDDIRRTLAVDDQPPVKAAVSRIEQLRTDLLSAMFNREKKK